MLKNIRFRKSAGGNSKRDSSKLKISQNDRNKKLRKFRKFKFSFAKVSLASLIIFALSFASWLNFAPKNSEVSRAEEIQSVSVANLAQLFCVVQQHKMFDNNDNCVGAVFTNKNIDVSIAQSFVWTGAQTSYLNVGTGWSATIHSADPANPAVLSRANNQTSNLLNTAGGTLTLRDIILDGNAANQTVPSGRLIYAHGGTVNIEEGAILRNNSAAASDDNCQNAGVRAGGAIQADTATTVVNINGGKFLNNAATFGGAIDFRLATVNINSGEFVGNEAFCSSGGAINMGGAAHLAISGETKFSDNISADTGGAIYVSRANLPNLTIDSANVIFTNNRASFKTTILPEDQEIYDANIRADKWSDNLKNGYNNYDISYPQTFIATFKIDENSAKNEVILSGEVLPQPENPAKSGYIFGGWFVDEKYAKTFDFSSPILSDLTIYAKWEKLCEYNSEIFADDKNCVAPKNPDENSENSNNSARILPPNAGIFVRK